MIDSADIGAATEDAPDDVKALAVPVLAHRLVLGYGLDNSGNGASGLIEKILETTPIPTEDFTA